MQTDKSKSKEEVTLIRKSEQLKSSLLFEYTFINLDFDETNRKITDKISMQNRIISICKKEDVLYFPVAYEDKHRDHVTCKNIGIYLKTLGHKVLFYEDLLYSENNPITEKADNIVLSQYNAIEKDKCLSLFNSQLPKNFIDKIINHGKVEFKYYEKFYA
jgi:hypothetical protein